MDAGEDKRDAGQARRGSRTGPVSPLTALGVTLAAQTLVSMSLAAPSVLAPVAAADLGVPAQHVGWLISLAYVAAMVSGLGGGSLTARYGAVRLTRWAVVACAAGTALFAAGWSAALVAAALVIGAGYGVTNPTAADILSRHAPERRRGLFFSVKQSGVPVGVALAGALLPWLAVSLGWRAALLWIALPLAVIGLALGAARARLEPSRVETSTGDRAATPQAPPLRVAIRSGLYEPLREVFSYAPTRRLALVSLAYALTQVSFLTFLVSLLVIEHEYPLALAAGLLAGAQAMSVAGRVGWGHVSDHWVDPTLLLGALGLTMGAGIALLGLAPHGTPWLAMLAITLLCAATVVGWNGVYFADLVRKVPPVRVARTTGATQFITFVGGMTGSGLFAALVSVTGSYRHVYVALALIPALAGAMMILRWRRA